MYPNKLIVTGQLLVTAAGTAEQITADAILVNKVKIKALKANTDVVYIGDSTVDSTTGFVLAPDAELDLKDLLPDGTVIDLSTIYLDSAVNSEGVSFVYVL